MKHENHAVLRILTPRKHAQFEELLVKYLDSMYTIAISLTRSVHDAEDLVQEASLRAFRAFDRVEELVNAKSWLLTILYNVFRNDYQKNKRAPFTDVELTEELISSASVRRYDQDAVFGRLLDDEVQQALARLPVEFQTVVLLADIEDCTHDEIGEILGCPKGTVASRLFRGRQLLRESLEDYAKQRGFL